MPRRPLIGCSLGAAAVLAAATTMFSAPPAPATPAACTTDCAVAAHSGGYLAPVTEVADGATVMFSSLDTSHPTDEAFATTESCFAVSLDPHGAPIPVRFDVVDGGLLATDPDGTSPCSTAVALSGGAQQLTFRCRIHPWMFGSVVVS